MYSYRSYTHEDMEANINVGKNALLGALVRQGVITEEAYKDWTDNYAIIIKKPNFFSSTWNKLVKKTDDNIDGLRVIVVKQISLNYEELKVNKKEGEQNE